MHSFLIFHHTIFKFLVHGTQKIMFHKFFLINHLKKLLIILIVLPIEQIFKTKEV